jgi:uncharacterized protein (DUF924 family)
MLDPRLSLPSPAQVLAHWRALGPDRWFVADEAVDSDLRSRFLPLYAAAAGGLLKDWENDAEGALALVLALDQFPRNMFRGTSAAFMHDSFAREVAGRAIARGFDRQFGTLERRFFYLPFMHSEDVADQERCCELCRAAEDQEGLAYAEEHAAIIRRFGRFPHRNGVLGRATTPEERAFLDRGGFSG